MKTPINNNNLDKLFNKAKADEQGLDDFEKDALAGFNMLDSEKEAQDIKAALDTRINNELFNKEEEKNNPKIYWLAAAGLALVIGLSTLFILNDNTSISKTNDLAISNTVNESEEKTLLDSKKELKEQAAVPMETAITNDEPDPVKKIAAEKLDEKQKAGNEELKDAGAKADAKTVGGVTSRMVLPCVTKSPTDIAQFEKEKEERKKGTAGSGATNDQSVTLDNLAKTSSSKDKETDNFKTTTKTNEDLNFTESEITVKDEVASDDAKKKGKMDANSDRDAEKNINQTAVATNNATNNNDKLNREESLARGKKAKRANNKQSSTQMAGPEDKNYSPGSQNSPKATGEVGDINAKPTEGYKSENFINCYYTGGEPAVTKDLKEKLVAQNLDQKFDVTLFVSEKKVVEKVEYINSYDLTKKQKEDITKILKTLNKFNFFVSPTKKELFQYKVLYRP